MTHEEYRKIISDLDLDVRILARELYGSSDALGGDTAIRAIDRMMADLDRLRASLITELKA